MDYDIAAVALFWHAKKYFYPEITQRGHRLFYGKVEEKEAAPEDLYKQIERIGVKKVAGQQSPFPQKIKDADQEVINKARGEIKDLAGDLYEKIFEEAPKNN